MKIPSVYLVFLPWLMPVSIAGMGMGWHME